MPPVGGAVLCCVLHLGLMPHLAAASNRLRNIRACRRIVPPRRGVIARADLGGTLCGCRAAPGARDTKERVGVVMPGERTWRPYVGLVVRLCRDYYDQYDHAWDRIGVVVSVQPAAAVAVVVTRTTHPDNDRDIPHGADLTLGCDRPGAFQPATRAYRVPFAAFDDPSTLLYGPLDPDTLAKVIDRWEQG